MYYIYIFKIVRESHLEGFKKSHLYQILFKSITNNNL